MRRLRASLLVFSAVSLLAATAAAQDVKDDGTTDHSLVVGHLGVGYFGQFSMPLGAGVAGPGVVAANPVPLELVGVRYWFDDRVGLDVALGLGVQSGSTSVNGVSSDRPSIFGLGLHVGVPVALYNGKHYSFVVIPQATYGHESETIKATGAGAQDNKHTGYHFQIGAALGGIFHFGFIGIPQLTLDATVGLLADVNGGGTTVGTGDANFSTFGLTTSTAHQPWNIFFSNVAAIYHF